MNFLPEDTDPEAMRIWYETLKRLGPERRLQMALEAGDNLRLNLECGVRARHPEFDDRQVKREVARLMLGDELFKRAFTDRGR